MEYLNLWQRRQEYKMGKRYNLVKKKDFLYTLLSIPYPEALQIVLTAGIREQRVWWGHINSWGLERSLFFSRLFLYSYVIMCFFFPPNFLEVAYEDEALPYPWEQGNPFLYFEYFVLRFNGLTKCLVKRTKGRNVSGWGRKLRTQEGGSGDCPGFG